MARSFKTYVVGNYEDEIYDAIDDYLQEHPEELAKKCSSLHQMGDVNLDSIEIMMVYTNQKSDDELEIQISVRAIIDCAEGDHHYDDDREVDSWFTIFASGSLSKMLRDFIIDKVAPYGGPPRYQHPLKDNFVPDIKKSDLDAVAEQVLQQYCPETLKQPLAIDTDMLLDRLSLVKVERRISQDASVFGRIYFEEADADFYNEDTENVESAHVTAGTIFVDPLVFFLRTMGSVKNTIIHECIHWYFHRPVFYLEKLYDALLTQIDCQVVGGVRGRSWSAAEQIEWQANALTPRIQMPKSTFNQKANELIAELIEERETDSVLDVIETVIEQLAVFFEVSKLSAKIRMVELGYEEARGAFIYLDGHYVFPHTCKPGFLKMQQTFSISFLDAIQLGLTSYDLREDLRSREFVYVDSHFVYNRPKYVQHTNFGLEMTAYALEHMDECCLVFDMEVKSGCGKDYQSVCFLNRAEDSRITFEPQYANGLEKAGPQAQAKAQIETANEAYTVVQSLPGSYAAALTKLVESSGMKVEDIAAETGVSSKTIKGMMKDEDRGSYESLAYVCLSLQLHPVLSGYLIERSPWKCDFRNKGHVALHEALCHFYGHRMDYIHAKIASFVAE